MIHFICKRGWLFIVGEGAERKWIDTGLGAAADHNLYVISSTQDVSNNAGSHWIMGMASYNYLLVVRKGASPSLACTYKKAL